MHLDRGAEPLGAHCHVQKLQGARFWAAIVLICIQAANFPLLKAELAPKPLVSPFFFSGWLLWIPNPHFHQRPGKRKRKQDG